jgi:pyrimidine operon attenuation protein/uracil phosphoribosyltransferase
MNTLDNLILSKLKLEQKIRRMAYNIWEQNSDFEEITLAGISGEGHTLARMLGAQIKAVSPLKTHLISIEIDKKLPHRFGQLNLDPVPKNVVLVDDVLNTGRTLFYALAAFGQHEIDKISVAVMVNRGHHLFPVFADVVGYELSTTIRQHISVVLEGEQAGVYLS